MKKVYLVKGLDCANCALSLEKKIEKIDGINSCSINFIMSKMTLECSDEAFESVKKACSTFEEGVTLKRIG